MGCKHEVIKCVNCVYFCDLCGARLTEDQIPTQKENAPEAKKPVKKRAKRIEDKTDS